MVRKKVGLEWTIAEEMRRLRLRWLGHVARMDESRLPFCLLFVGKLDGDYPKRGRKLVSIVKSGLSWRRTGRSGSKRRR